MTDREKTQEAGEKGGRNIVVQFTDDLEGGADFDFDPVQVAAAVAGEALDEEKCPYAAEVSLTLVGEDAIHALNRSARRIDRVTDVLSFPMTEYSAPGNFKEAEASGWDSFDPDTGRLMLGDIVICVPRVFSQAAEYGHSVKREYAFLIAHSLLHLMGYDHMTEEEEKVMFAKQEKILRSLNITRECARERS